MGAYSSLVLSHASLKAYYRLGEGSGTTLVDAGPNGLNGTYAGTGVTYGAAGAIQDGDTAVTFAGSSDAATVADNNALDLGDAGFSIEFWVKRSATQGAIQALVSKGTDAYVVRFASTNILAFFCGGGQVAATTVTITDTTTWHHVVVTKSGTARKLYVDAVDVTSLSTNQTATDNTTTLRIGHQSAATLRFPGSLDEIALYGAVLTLAEVLEHFHRGQGLLFLADAATASEAVAKAPQRNIADTASTGDAVAKATGKALADSATPAESCVEATGKVQADTATVSESRTATTGKPLADSVTPTDARSAAVGKTVTDSVTPSDATSRIPGKGLADSVTAIDVNVADADVALADTASVSDALTTAEGNFVVLGDSVTVTDQISPDLLEQFTQSVGDSVVVSDSVVLTVLGASGPAPSPGGWVPVIRTVKTEGHRLHFNDPVFLTDNVFTDRRLADIARDEELALALA